MGNYFDQMMTDTYTLLMSRRIKWPYELDNDQKVEFMERVLKYFSDIEDYQKCTAIQKKIVNFTKRNKNSYGKSKSRN
jgi:hypothetical protein